MRKSARGRGRRSERGGERERERVGDRERESERDKSTAAAKMSVFFKISAKTLSMWQISMYTSVSVSVSLSLALFLLLSLSPYLPLSVSTSFLLNTLFQHLSITHSFFLSACLCLRIANVTLRFR